MATSRAYVRDPVISEEEKTYFLRFGTGVLFVSTEALREFFNKKHPNLNADLTSNDGLLLNLKKKRVITNEQWNLLFPTSGKQIFSLLHSNHCVGLSG